MRGGGDVSDDERKMLMILWETRAGMERRCAELEDEVSTLKLAFEELTPCDECGVVFASRDDYGEHNCHGRQGR